MAEVLQSVRRSPGAHLREEMAAASVAGVVELREIVFLTQVGIRAEPGSPGHAAVQEAAGISLPAGIGAVTGTNEGVAALWLAPDEFLIASPESPDLVDRLVSGLGGHPGQVVDLSVNRSVLQLSGPAAPSVLRKSCPADLHPRAFEINHAILTTFANVPVILWRVDEYSWWVMPRSSFTQHVVRWTADAMREFAAD